MIIGSFEGNWPRGLTGKTFVLKGIPRFASGWGVKFDGLLDLKATDEGTLSVTSVLVTPGVVPGVLISS